MTLHDIAEKREGLGGVMHEKIEFLHLGASLSLRFIDAFIIVVEYNILYFGLRREG